MRNGAYEAALKYSRKRLQFGKTDRLVPTHSRPSGPDDRKHHGVAMLIVRQAQLLLKASSATPMRAIKGVLHFQVS